VGCRWNSKTSGRRCKTKWLRPSWTCSRPTPLDIFKSEDLESDFLPMEIEDRPRLRLKLIPPRGRTGHGDVGTSAVYALFRLKDEYAYVLYPPGSPAPKKADLASCTWTWCRRVFAPAEFAPYDESDIHRWEDPDRIPPD
jgi:hypothetical protein